VDARDKRGHDESEFIAVGMICSHFGVANSAYKTKRPGE
jgi:hypothetical protein